MEAFKAHPERYTEGTSKIYMHRMTDVREEERSVVSDLLKLYLDVAYAP